ncbi:unnamed protein product, partial [Polarella glacialis]
AVSPVARVALSLIGPVVGRWLVGESRLLNLEEGAEVLRLRGPRRGLASGAGSPEELVNEPVLLIKKCKFLEAVGGCKGLCLNMCKSATEEYLAKEFGLPVYMDPNLEDSSCRMMFLQRALPPDQDSALAQPCPAGDNCDNRFSARCGGSDAKFSDPDAEVL